MNEFPEEIRSSPQPLVCLIGALEIHASVIDACSAANTGNRMKFVSFDFGQVFPPKKERRVTYDNYTPVGILQSNWLFKHRNLIPSVVVLCFNWTDEPGVEWRDREAAVLHELDTLRNAHRARPWKYVVLMVYSGRGVDESSVDEKTAALRKRADIDAKSIFLVQGIDGFRGASKRFEKLLIDLAMVYYKEEGKRVKKLKTRLHRSGQVPLLVRHYFKIAYYAEFRGDVENATKYYVLSYDTLCEIPKDEHNMPELRTVASFICYRLFQLYLSTWNVQAAVILFKKLLAHFKQVNVDEGVMAFEHWSWLSRQYRCFAELLEQVALTNPGILNFAERWQHPGFFYQSAAIYAMERKRYALATLGNVPPPTSGWTLQPSPYVGQRPSRISHNLEVFLDSGGAPEQLLPPSEPDIVSLLLETERTTDHSLLIIDLLTRAYEKFKIQRSGRTILHIASLMADEYFTKEDYEMAKRFYDRIARTYRKERWQSLLASTLSRVWSCCRKMGNQRESLETILELLMVDPDQTSEQKQQRLRDVLGMLSVPTPDPVDMVFEVDVDRPLLTCRAQFQPSNVHTHQPTTLNVSLICHMPLEVQFDSVQVHFSQTEYNQTITDPTQLKLLPEQETAFTFNICITDLAVSLLDLEHVYLTLSCQVPERDRRTVSETGEPVGYSKVVFKFQPILTNEVVSSSTKGDHRVSIDSKDEMDKLDFGVEAEGLPRLRIRSPEPKSFLFVRHYPPALLGELYPIQIHITSFDGYRINQGTLFVDEEVPGSSSRSSSFLVQDGTASSLIRSDSFDLITGTSSNHRRAQFFYLPKQTPVVDISTLQPIDAQAGIPLQAIGPKDGQSIEIYGRFMETGEKKVTVLVKYETCSTSAEASSYAFSIKQQHSIELHALPPFDVNYRWFNLSATELIPSTSASPGSPAVSSPLPLPPTKGNDTNIPSPTLQPHAATVIPWMPSLSIGEPVVVVAEVKCRTGHHLSISNLRWKMYTDPTMESSPIDMLSSSGEIESPVDAAGSSGIVLESGQRISLCYQLLPKVHVDHWKLGHLAMTWRRFRSADGDGPAVLQESIQKGSERFVTSTDVPLPSVAVQHGSLGLQFEVPTTGVVGSPVVVTGQLRNQSTRLIKVQISVADNDTFFYSGVKEFELLLPPLVEEALLYRFLPLKPGLVMLPHISVQCSQLNRDLLDGVRRSILIRPSQTEPAA